MLLVFILFLTIQHSQSALLNLLNIFHNYLYIYIYKKENYILWLFMVHY